MALIHSFESSGNWLFRRRGWLPLFFLVPALAYMWLRGSSLPNYDTGRAILILSAGLLGQFIRAYTVGHTPRGTSGRNIKGQVAEELNTTGIYSMVRHPLYLGNFFMWLGPVLVLESFWFTITFSLAYWLYYERIMFAEEQFLRRKFGDAYDIWSENVSAFLPAFGKYKRPSLGFSLRNVLKREYHGLANMFIMFALTDLGRNWFLDNKLLLNPVWLWSLIIAMSLWIVIRIVVKTTKLLNVRGR